MINLLEVAQDDISNMYDRQLRYLDLVIKNNKFPNAFLFHGRDVVFQKETAKSFLARLNQPQWALSIKAEKHPDTLFIQKEEGKKDITVSQIAKLRKFASQTPLALNTKGIFITDAQHLNEEGWNALLKTLEEPAGQTIIFILAVSTKNIPATIISRAVALPFSGVENSLRPLNPKDDIILNKLEQLDQLSVGARFDLAEVISKKENAADVLDDWMLNLRIKMLEGGSPKEVKTIAAVAGLKDQLVNTNINPRLALENLLLNI
ncbi:MAG: hypothetical protein HYV54_01890 [Parcubacteria group bacterium]|nr:hypothetical protein [Parcubacteria group bacterium]